MKKIFRATIATGVLVLFPLLAFAATRPPGLTSLAQVQNILSTIADWMYTFALIVGVIMFMWGAFLYITANDDSEKMKKAKSTLIFGVIGLVVAMIATGIPEVIKAILGV